MSCRVVGCNCTSLPEVYARSMTEINLSGCKSLKKFWFKIFHEGGEDPDIFNTPLEKLNLDGCNALEYITIIGSALKSLDIGGLKDLKQIEIGANNFLSSVNAADCISMDCIDCGNNERLTDLNINGCSNLRILRCNNNKLSRLDLSSCSNLVILYCLGNEIAYLDLDKNFSLEDNYDNGYYFRLNSQKIHNLKAKRAGEFWQIDFKDYMPLEKVKYINTININFYDGAGNYYWSNAYFSFDPSTGIMLLKSDFPPAIVEYNYHTRSNPSNKDMHVQLVHNQIYPYVFMHSKSDYENFNGYIYIHDISKNGYLYYTNTWINGSRKKNLINEQYINENKYILYNKIYHSVKRKLIILCHTPNSKT